MTKAPTTEKPALDKAAFVPSHQKKSITLPQELVKKLSLKKNTVLKNICVNNDKVKSNSNSNNNTKNNKSSENKLTHQKYNFSDLKRTIIIDAFGNNNLNVPRKKMKSNITNSKVNKVLMLNAINTNPNMQENGSSLFVEESTSTYNNNNHGDDSREANPTFPNFIIFDEKQRSEIDAIKFLPDEGEEDKEDNKEIDTSFIDIDQDLDVGGEENNEGNLNLSYLDK